MLARAFATLLIFGFFVLPACPVREAKRHLDGGRLIVHDFEVYWRQEHLPITVYIDVNMPLYMEGGTIEAVEVWNQKLGHEIFTIEFMDIPAELPPVQCGWIVVTTVMYQEKTGLWSSVYESGSSTTCVGQITFRVDTDKVIMKKLALHELGHALGLAHDDHDNRSIMYPVVFSQSPQYIMPDDIQAIQEMYDGTFIPLSEQDVLQYHRILAERGID